MESLFAESEICVKILIIATGLTLTL